MDYFVPINHGGQGGDTLKGLDCYLAYRVTRYITLQGFGLNEGEAALN